MKDPENNNLDQLFNKAKVDAQSLDDFEKDAIAGFDTLGSKDEAQQLKAALDKRIHKELFAKEEKNNPKIYWLAAAGLALVIGLSTLFVINNNDSVSKPNNLAITTTQPESDKTVLPDTKPQAMSELKEQAAPPPIEKVVSSAEQAPAQETERDQQITSKKGLLDEEVSFGKEKSAKEPKARMIIMPAKSQEAKDIPATENETSDRRKDANGEGVASRSDNIGGMDDLAKTKGTKDKDAESTVFKAPVSTAKTDEAPKLAEAQKIEGKATSSSGYFNKEKEKSDKKTADEDGQKNLDQSVASNNVNTNGSNREESNGGKNSKKERAKSHTVATGNAAAGAETITYTPGSPSYNTQMEATTVTNATPADSKKSEPVNLYYLGGEAAITKDLKEKLIPANLNQKFDATLFINEKKEVDKTEFTNAYSLTPKQKEEITKILRSLTKFNFFINPTTKSVFVYKLNYKP